MQRHWQKKPLLIRGAMPGFRPLLSRTRLFALAALEEVESRLIVRHTDEEWTLEQGPFKRSAFPRLSEPGWTLLVQGVDLHDDAAHALLQTFRFVPDARLDDLMMSWASASGGVGPHIDSYDVFLLQAQGRRRWRIGLQKDPSFDEHLPLKMLSNFKATQEYVLEPGDMLYLPPKWGHDGVAEGGDCMTYSIGFQAPERAALAGEIVQRMAEDFDDDVLFRDVNRSATRRPAQIPFELQAFAADAVRRLVERPHALTGILGEMLTEPKPGISFEGSRTPWVPGAVVLDRRTRMMYDRRNVFINGECHRIVRGDASVMRRLADERCLDGPAVARASAAARSLLAEWFEAGWLHSRES